MYKKIQIPEDAGVSWISVKRCGNCDGLGYNIRLERCRNCDGQGVVVKKEDLYRASTYTVEETGITYHVAHCKVCDGFGYVWYPGCDDQAAVCHDCDGQGVVCITKEEEVE